MPCTSVAPELDAVGRARYVTEHLPPGLFRVADGAEGNVPWRVSPEPFPLTPKTVAAIESLGNDLLAFYRALNALYLRSARGTAPAYIAEELDRGKPEQIVKLARQNRFKQDIPRVIRPDLILTEDGYVASERDSVPGGMGFTNALAHTYCEIGSDSIGGADGIAERFAEMIRGLAASERPTVALVVSQESADYRAELSWLAGRVNAFGGADVVVCRPQDVAFTEEALFVRREDGRETKIDVLYRNFELFDLLNISKQELILYAARHNRVRITPPPKAHLEEKSSFALFHHPGLRAYWRAELGPQVDEGLLEAQASFDTTPYILQRFHKGKRVRVPFLGESGEIKEMDGRVRLCPYYFVVGDETKLGGILATIAPADKRLIHGMSDAIMASCRVADDGY